MYILHVRCNVFVARVGYSQCSVAQERCKRNRSQTCSNATVGGEKFALQESPCEEHLAGEAQAVDMCFGEPRVQKMVFLLLRLRQERSSEWACERFVDLSVPPDVLQLLPQRCHLKAHRCAYKCWSRPTKPVRSQVHSKTHLQL